jgi:hypothetical protein
MLHQRDPKNVSGPSPRDELSKYMEVCEKRNALQTSKGFQGRSVAHVSVFTIHRKLVTHRPFPKILRACVHFHSLHARGIDIGHLFILGPETSWRLI